MIDNIVNEIKNNPLTKNEIRNKILLSFSLGLDKNNAFKVLYNEIQELVQKTDNVELLFSLIFENHPVFKKGIADVIEDISHVDCKIPFGEDKNKIISVYLEALENKASKEYNL